MPRYLNYLRYVLRHKWFVFLATIRIGGSLWRALTHDLSKFLPSEFIPYADCFYSPSGESQYVEHEAFNQAWNSHQKRNKHHWQYWVLSEDDGGVYALPMPKKYIYEMYADWSGAARAIRGKWDTKDWFDNNRIKMELHPYTESQIRKLVKKYG